MNQLLEILVSHMLSCDLASVTDHIIRTRSVIGSKGSSCLVGTLGRESLDHDCFEFLTTSFFVLVSMSFELSFQFYETEMWGCEI